MGTLIRDLRYAFRQFAESPGLAAAAILALALGIGVNAAVFSLVNSFLIRPLPVKHPGQLVVLAFQQDGGSLETQFSYADMRDIRQQTSGVFQGLLAYQFGLDGLSVKGQPNRIMTCYVTGNYFTLLGLRPALGRLILPSEGKVPGADPVLVLSYQYWRMRFNGSPNVIGQVVSLNGRPVTIVGVTPKGFRGVYSLLHMQGYLPLSMSVLESWYRGDFMTNRDERNLFVLGRIKPGVSLNQAQAVLNVVGRRLAEEHLKSDRGLTLHLYPERLARPDPQSGGPLVDVSALFLALAALVLLLACVNVANILLVRATSRQREIAIRFALGAGRGHVIRQLLTESVLLAALGGVAGLILGVWTSHMLGAVDLHTSLPLRFDFHFDWRVFAYSFATALLAGMIVGMVPALRATRANLDTVMHESGRSGLQSHQRVRSMLVVAQVAGCLMLLVVAGLFTRSLWNAQQTNLGFDPHHVLNLGMDPHEAGYGETKGREFYRELLARVRTLPGVQSASLAFSVPMSYISAADPIEIDGYTPPPGQPAPTVSYNTITPGYFRTMRIPIIGGRSFTDADDEHAQSVAIVNETMAKRFWPHSDAVGQRFRIAMATPSREWIRVVGVARNSKYQNILERPKPYFYLPIAQHFMSVETLQIRTVGATETVIAEVRREVESLIPGLPVFGIETMTQALEGLNGFQIFRMGAVLAAALGVLGLVLALVGVYGVVSYAASQRTHEIGIRMALGAQRTDILRMIFRQGVVMASAGLAVGLLLSLAAARVVGNFLVGVRETDPMTYLSVSSALLLVVLGASYVPARRATHTDPAAALRHQ